MTTMWDFAQMSFGIGIGLVGAYLAFAAVKLLVALVAILIDK